MKYLLAVLMFTGCTYDYTVGIQTTEERYVKHIYLKKEAKFDICYDNGHYCLGFFSPISPKPKRYTGIKVTGFEILNVQKKQTR